MISKGRLSETLIILLLLTQGSSGHCRNIDEGRSNTDAGLLLKQEKTVAFASAVTVSALLNLKHAWISDINDR